MKIAVATFDDESISSHFRHSDRFAVVEVQGGKVLSTEARELQGHGQPHAHDSAGHDHSDALGLLADCSVVICGGMGARIAEALSRYGIEPVVALECELTPENAALQFAAGQLRRGNPHGCCCEQPAP